MNARPLLTPTLTPLVSAVIPTCGRGLNLLGRAIDSALATADHDEVEVLVVPNGPSRAWEQTALRYEGHRRVAFLPISTSGACAARNHGLRSVKGRYVRFLDDDDVLYPAGAKEQLAAIEQSNADLCSGSIEVFNPAGKLLRLWQQPAVDDFVVATLSPLRTTLTHAHLYRVASLKQDQWDENLAIGQDFQWMLALCSRHERHWVKVSTPVGAWLHHHGPRLFPGKHPGASVTWQFAKMIESTVTELEARGALTDERRIAAADGLWGCFQKGFMYSPNEWLQVADLADKLAARRRPPSSIYKIPPFSRIDPRITEILLTPIRFIHAVFRYATTNLMRGRRPA